MLSPHGGHIENNVASDRSVYDLAREVAETARTYAASSEALGYVHPNVLAAMQDAGLPQMLKPGTEHSFRDFIHVCGLLAEGCMSSGWCNFVWGMHNYLVALYPQRVQSEVWQEPATLVSASLGPVGSLEGARLSGRWRFNSGCDHAEWLLLGATPQQGEPQLALVRKSEIEIIDTWQVMGLAGTGSKDAACKDLELAGDRIQPFSAVIEPFRALLILVIVGPVIGGAQSAVDAFARLMTTKVVPGTTRRMADEQTVALRLSEASAEVDAARTLTLAAADALDEDPTPGQPATNKIMRDTAYAAKLSNQATRRLFEAAGGSALHESNELQRIFRDVTAGCAQGRLLWDGAAEPYGRMLLRDATARPAPK